jgi:hypothetical protein
MADKSKIEWTDAQDKKAQELAEKFDLPFYLFRGDTGWYKRFFSSGNLDAAGPVTVLLWKALEKSDSQQSQS